MHNGIQVRYERARGCGFRKPGGLYLFSDSPGRFCGFLPIELTTCPTCGQSMCPEVGKQNRGFSWIEDFSRLITANDKTGFCAHPEAPEYCQGCPLGGAVKLKRVGLIWIGKEFYPTPKDFTDEADQMGVSRRLPMTQTVSLETKLGTRKVPAIPRGFKVGETWVALAHPEVVKNTTPQPEIKPGLSGGALFEAEQEQQAWKPMNPGIFYMYRPQRIEYVVKPDEVNDGEFIEYLTERGITPVHVVKIGQADEEEGEFGEQGDLPFGERRPKGESRKIVGKSGKKKGGGGKNRGRKQK